jgi:hypothetical protein
MFTGGSAEANVRSGQVRSGQVTSHDSFNNNYTKYLIIKLSLLKKASNKRNNEIITQYLMDATVV